MKVIVQKIERQWAMEYEDFEWLQQHLGEELEVFSLTFESNRLTFESNRLAFVTIRAYNDNDASHTITLFHNNGVKIKLIGMEDLACVDTI